MKLLKCLVVVVFLAGFVTLAGHSGEPDKEKIAGLMKRKLTHSQKVLEGLALNDFKAIAENGDELIAISKEAEWKVLKTPQYELYSNDFRRTADELVKNARDKNIDGAALNYVELTLTCVKCHKHVREARWAKAD
jgi:cytochrome c556